MPIVGVVSRVSGPVVVAKDVLGAKMYELVRVGEEKLIGEIIRVEGDRAVIQVYEETTGLKPGEPVLCTGEPLSVELGPGLIGQIYDGVQRPLPDVEALIGPFLRRGYAIPALDRRKKWSFRPTVKPGIHVSENDVIGIVSETSMVDHRVMIPPGVRGELTYVVDEGDYTVEDTIAVVEREGEKNEVKLMHRWPVRRARPYVRKLPPETPLTTGQRIIDVLFPMAKGGTAAIPGGFGTGKCVTPDTPILLSNGEVVRADELFSYMAKEGVTVNDGDESYVLCLNPVNVISLHQGKLSGMDSYIAYKGSSKRIIKIRTRRGRSVKVTPNHPLFIVTQKLEIAELPAGEVKPGMYILAPRKLKVKTHDELIEFYDLLDGSLRCCDPETNRKVSMVLKRLAEKYGSLKLLAKVLDISYDTLLGYCLCRNAPTLEFLRKLSKFIGERFRVKSVKGERRSMSIMVPENLSPELAEYLGLILSDGSIIGRSVCFFNNDDAVLDRFSELTYKLFKVKSKRTRTKTVGKLIVHSVALVKVLESLGVPKGHKSDFCRIPKLVMRGNDRILASFLCGYLAGDGSIYGYTLEISTASRGMCIDLAYALTRLGVLYRLSEKKVDDKIYYRISIEGRDELRRLYENLVNSYEYPYLGKIRKYVEKTGRGFNSIDVVPIDGDELKRIARRLKVGRKSFEMVGIHITNYTHLNEKPSAETFRKIVNLLTKYGRPEDDKDLETLERLKLIDKLLEYVYFDEIAEVKVLEIETPVYDLSIPETRNFVGGIGPLVLHNTVMQHQLAQWADADIVIYVGCGERGNEMAEVLERFPELKDPRTGKPLMDRTILVANVSNMPIAAREASVYTGMTMAEYFRDMGYDVALMADSTSRWAEALREISGRLGEMPGEEGYPAYLASRLAEFYERAGKVECLGSPRRVGSISVIGAVSPPGGDFSEPVTVNTLRIVKVFWALDSDLAHRRHFPAINWLRSYSLYLDDLSRWFRKHVDPEWDKFRAEAMYILQREEELREIVQLVGPDALSDAQRVYLEIARMIREDFLMQHAYHPVDTYCPIEKAREMLKAILKMYRLTQRAVEKGVPLQKILETPLRMLIARMKIQPMETFGDYMKKLNDKMDRIFSSILR